MASINKKYLSPEALRWWEHFTPAERGYIIQQMFEANDSPDIEAKEPSEPKKKRGLPEVPTPELIAEMHDISRNISRGKPFSPKRWALFMETYKEQMMSIGKEEMDKARNELLLFTGRTTKDWE